MICDLRAKFWHLLSDVSYLKSHLELPIRTVIFEGTPGELAKCEASAVGASIREKVLKKIKA